MLSDWDLQSQAGKNEVKQLVVILTIGFYGARYEESHVKQPDTLIEDLFLFKCKETYIINFYFYKLNKLKFSIKELSKVSKFCLQK
ncbi:MAG: hypothetical protein HC836_16295 [Richelia sp. RM2_1_2]|nr:hypothetical protein [Richelia sp. RM2_1_2]